MRRLRPASSRIHSGSVGSGVSAISAKIARALASASRSKPSRMKTVASAWMKASQSAATAAKPGGAASSTT